MELARGEPGKRRIEQINELAISQCLSIDAAIAYVTDQTTLLDCCLKADKPLKIWVLYDYSIPCPP